MQEMRGRVDQVAEVVQSLTGQVEDLTENIAAYTPARENVKTNVGETENINKLVAQMQSLIEKTEKRKRSRKPVIPATTADASSASDSEVETAKKRHIIKPPKFDGNGPFEMFYAHFTNCAQHHGWSESEQLSWLKSSLIEEAQDKSCVTLAGDDKHVSQTC